MSIRLIAKSVWNNPGNRGKQLRKSFDAVLWQFQKHSLRSQRTLRLPNGVLFQAYPDCVVSSSLIYADWPEYYELKFIREELRNGDAVIDVGANVGHISLLLADVVDPSNIFAFEPTPVSFQRLVRNWELNGWPTTGLFQVAIGAKPGSVFVRDIDRPVTTNNVANSPYRERCVEVPLKRLDDLRHLWQKQEIGFVKIDVEGYEDEVFRGCRNILETSRPHLVMFESLSNTVDPRIASLLTEFQYILFQLDSQGRPDTISDSDQNLFAIPRERRGRLEQ